MKERKVNWNMELKKFYNSHKNLNISELSLKFIKKHFIKNGNKN